jgi:hypothetical protein
MLLLTTSLDDAKLQKSNPKAVSPLESINGTDVAKFLQSYASGQSLQDHDAQYVAFSLPRQSTRANITDITECSLDWPAVSPTLPPTSTESGPPSATGLMAPS